MAKKPSGSDDATYYLEMLSLQSVLPINTGLRSAQEETMISCLGSPKLPLTITDQPDRASPRVIALRDTRNLSAHVKVTGIKPALDSAGGVLTKAIAAETSKGHDLNAVLGTEGMLVVRYRKPTSGLPSTKISNHAWGTAIDFKIVGHPAPGNNHDQVPRFIAVLIPFFNEAGWYSGISFHDSMHFEVADQAIEAWAHAGKLNP